MSQANGYDLQSVLRSEFHRAQSLACSSSAVAPALELCSEPKIQDFARNKVSNLKMEDIDDTENTFGDGVDNRGVDYGDDEIEMRNLNPYDSSSRRGSEDTTYLSSHTRTHGETSFIEGIDEHTRLITEESKRDEAWGKIRSKFPKVGTTKFTATLDDIGRVFVKLIREKGKYHPLFNSDGEVNEKLPKTIIEALGPSAEDIIGTNEEEISRREKKIEELKASRETASEIQKEQN